MSQQTMNERLEQIEKEIGEACFLGYNARLHLEKKEREWAEERKLIEAQDLYAQQTIDKLQREKLQIEEAKQQLAEGLGALSKAGGMDAVQPPTPAPQEAPTPPSLPSDVLRPVAILRPQNGPPEREHEGVPER